MKLAVIVLALTFILSLSALAENSFDKDLDCGICYSRAISLPSPLVPETAVPRGVVCVRINIDKKDRVKSASLESGALNLCEACEAAAIKARFRPFQRKAKLRAPQAF